MLVEANYAHSASWAARTTAPRVSGFAKHIARRVHRYTWTQCRAGTSICLVISLHKPDPIAGSDFIMRSPDKSVY